MNDYNEKYVDLDWVLGMLHTMIEESIYHTETFAHSLEVHHNDKAAKVFHLISKQFKAEQNIVLKHTLNIDLPNIPPWEVPYAEYQHPSSVLINTDYLISESQAWKLMNEMIEIHKGFYNFLFQEHTEGTIYSIVDQLVNYCSQCGLENKKLEMKADTEQSKSLEDIDIVSLHSSEGGLW